MSVFAQKNVLILGPWLRNGNKMGVILHSLDIFGDFRSGLARRQRASPELVTQGAEPAESNGYNRTGSLNYWVGVFTGFLRTPGFYSYRIFFIIR